jgi:putative CocE/NonD family hydrolase
MTIEYMVEDQRFAGRRPDVLVYQTEPFTEDCVIAGPIKVKLWVTNSNTDADFVVKLIDVHPDSTHPADQPNFQRMLRSEVLRGKFRNSFEKPEPFIPGKPTEIEIELLDVLHRFKPGHRMMIQVQSTWFPLVDRNPQKFIPNIYFAKPEDFEKATIGILRSDLHSSRIEVGVLK